MIYVPCILPILPILYNMLHISSTVVIPPIKIPIITWTCQAHHRRFAPGGFSTFRWTLRWHGCANGEAPLFVNPMPEPRCPRWQEFLQYFMMMKPLRHEFLCVWVWGQLYAAITHLWIILRRKSGGDWIWCAQNLLETDDGSILKSLITTEGDSYLEPHWINLMLPVDGETWHQKCMMMLDLGLKVEIFDRDQLMGESMIGATSSTLDSSTFWYYWYILGRILGPEIHSERIAWMHWPLKRLTQIYLHHIRLLLYRYMLYILVRVGTNLQSFTCQYHNVSLTHKLRSWTHPSHALLSRAAKVTRVWRWETSGEGGWSILIQLISWYIM